MNPAQTTVATPSHLAQGWLTSLALHGFLLCTVIVFARQSPITLSTERFQWDVTLVQSTHIPKSSTPPTNVAMQPSEQMPTPHSAAIHRSPRAATPYSKAVGTVQPMVDPKSLSEPQPETSASMHQVSPQSESTHANLAPRYRQRQMNHHNLWPRRLPLSLNSHCGLTQPPRAPVRCRTPFHPQSIPLRRKVQR